MGFFLNQSPSILFIKIRSPIEPRDHRFSQTSKLNRNLSLCSQSWDYRYMNRVASTWFLDIQTQFLVLAQLALY